MTTSDNAQQGIFQVRFDWGAAGLHAIAADADVVVLVDVLEHRDVSAPLETPAVVIAGDLRNRRAAARWVLAHQTARGERAMIAVIAAGEVRGDGSLRFTVEDLLAAGSIIDALASEGIDYCSPEAAVACAAFTGLQPAVGHLLTASVSGMDAARSGSPANLEALASIDSSDEVSVVQEYDSQA